LRLKLAGKELQTLEVYVGGIVIVRRKIVGGVAAALTASGLMFATAAPAAADVAPHKHCLLTPDGYVLLAEGVTDEAPNLALEKFHVEVHTGVPAGEDGRAGTDDDIVTIIRIDPDEDCSSLPVPVV
jgi:hypothetical protein